MASLALVVCVTVLVQLVLVGYCRTHPSDIIYFPSSDPFPRRRSHTSSSTTTSSSPSTSSPIAPQSPPQQGDRAFGRKGHASRNEIPIDLAKRFNKVESVDDFLAEFVKNVPKTPISIADRFNDERSNEVVPEPARCQPEMQTVQLKTSDPDPGVISYPTCTRVPRCGGCCDHHRLECQPIETETINFKVSLVIVTQFHWDEGLNFKGHEIVPIEKHNKCQCDCRIKAEHCNAWQEYRENDCLCQCKNTDEEDKCLQDDRVKVWDNDICACRCREALECSTGAYYDLELCKCVAENIAKRYVHYTPEEIRQIQEQRKSLKVRPTIAD